MVSGSPEQQPPEPARTAAAAYRARTCSWICSAVIVDSSSARFGLRTQGSNEAGHERPRAAAPNAGGQHRQAVPLDVALAVSLDRGDELRGGKHRGSSALAYRWMSMSQPDIATGIDTCQYAIRHEANRRS